MGPPAYFPGISPVQMHTLTTDYGSVAYQNLYNGISLDFYTNSSGQLEYDWQLAAGANVGLVQVQFQGADQLSLDGQSNLVVTAGGQTLVEHAPVAYQDIDGVRQVIPAQFVLEGNNQVGIALGNYDASQPLTIDPVITTKTNGLLAPAQVTSSQGSTPDSIGTLTLDDGSQLVLVANFYSNNVTLMRQGSNGQLQVVGQLATGAGPNGFAVGDFTGSGHQAFAVANFASGTISVFTGDGQGNFQLAQTITAGTTPSNELAVGDFNGDGKLDICSANQGDGTVSVFLNTGNAAAPFASAQTYSVGTGVDCITAGDFSGTGRADLAVGNFNDSTVTLLTNNGDGTFSVGSPVAVGANPWYLASGDFDGDGKDDLATANFYGGVSVLLSNGDGTFQSAVNYAASSNPTGIVAADIDGDGTRDLAVSNFGSNDVSLLLGNGDGTFQSAQEYGAGSGSGPNGIAAADVTGSGRVDLVVADQGTSAASLLANQSLQGTSGQAFHGTLTTFTDSDSGAVPGDFIATITWGDGQVTTVGPEAFSEDASGVFHLTASHVFALAGAYGGSVTISDDQGDDTTASFRIGIQAATFGTVTGSIFSDFTGNGQFQSGDSTLAGWTVQLLGSGGQVIASAQTAADGTFSFSNVPAGSYTLQEMMPGGWTQTAGGNETVLVSAGFTATVSLGNFQDFTIQGSKFDDLNADGVWETGEPALVGWTIQLYTMTDGELSASPLQTTTTDANGAYQFTNLGPLPADSFYVVAESQPSGWAPSCADGRAPQCHPPAQRPGRLLGNGHRRPGDPDEQSADPAGRQHRHRRWRRHRRQFRGRHRFLGWHHLQHRRRHRHQRSHRPAPQAVYQTERYGNFTYTMPNLTPAQATTFAWTSPRSIGTRPASGSSMLPSTATRSSPTSTSSPRRVARTRRSPRPSQQRRMLPARSPSPLPLSRTTPRSQASKSRRWPPRCRALAGYRHRQSRRCRLCQLQQRHLHRAGQWQRHLEHRRPIELCLSDAFGRWHHHRSAEQQWRYRHLCQGRHHVPR